MYALMTGKTQELYELVIDRMLLVLEREGYPKPRLTSMLSDYESAIIAAMRSRFEGAHAHGCFFHYGQVSFLILICFFYYVY